MNPNRFANLARRLMHDISVEARRTVVNRYYYAAHHSAFALLVKRGRKPPSKRAKRHRWAVKELKKLCPTAAELLYEMAEYRKWADYDLQRHRDAWFHRDNLRYVSLLYREFMIELKQC